MTTQPQKPNPFVKLAIDFGPLLVFFITNSQFGIFNATGAFMVAMVVALIVSKKMLDHIPVMTLVTGVIVMVFGGLTLYLNDEIFIKLKPTIINGMFAAILFVGLMRGKYLLERVFGPAFPPMEQRGWYLLTRNWAIFFVFLALLNEYIWRNYSTDFWVSFKVFGMMPISFVFTFTQVPILMKYADMSDNEEEKQD
jgi:intracellular septation protein